MEKCNCEQSLELIQDLHVVAKSIQLLTGRESLTKWDDLDPAWEVLNKHGYKFTLYPNDFVARPDTWKRKQ